MRLTHRRLRPSLLSRKRLRANPWATRTKARSNLRPDLLTGEGIFAREQARLRSRRRALDGFGARPSDDPETVGLALSGGGIRSATFSLGILRALGDAGLIPAIDYLSTVSGGSYIGSFLCSHYVPSAWRGDAVHLRDGVASGGTGNPSRVLKPKGPSTTSGRAVATFCQPTPGMRRRSPPS